MRKTLPLIGIFAVLLASCTSLPITAATIEHPHKLPDDGSKDSEFAQFRARMLDALKRHDKAFVEETLSPSITMALGGSKGKTAFSERWDNLSPTSPFWGKMQKILSHGAEYDADASEYHAPALSFEDNHSELPQCIVWNDKSALRKEPDINAPMLRTLSDQQVTLLAPAELTPVTASWVKVRLNDGTIGFLKTDDIYSAYDEFAVFKKQQKKWVLSWFGFAGL